MESILMATVGPKGQTTLPKKVREFLGITDSGEFLGFTFDNKLKTVRLTRLRIEPTEEFTEEEYKKLLALPKKKGGKKFTSMKGLIHDLES